MIKETPIVTIAAAQQHQPPKVEVQQTTVELSENKDEIWDASKFSRWRKCHILIAGISCTFNASLGTSLPSGALDAISQQFAVTNKVHLALLNSMNMIGFVLGPLFFGPLSEYVGRRPVLISSFLGYTVFMLACSGAPNYPALLIFRFLCGINAAAPISVVGGVFADVLHNPSQRGAAIALFMAINTLGALVAPMISGFTSQVSWRWPFWTATLIAAPAIPLVLTIPETFAPVLRNKQIRKWMKGGECAEVSQTQLQPFDARKIFLRPVTLMISEPILLLSALYLCLTYSIFYLMFQAYPMIFQDMYDLSPGIAALAYIPMIIGTGLALVGFYAFTWWYDRCAAAGKQWAQREINRRLPIACVASPCMVISLFWLGWTSQKSFSPIVPSIAGLFFGIGFQLIFISMLNFITDVFKQFSASAHAGAGCVRSVCAILVPLAAGPMYNRLGIHWAPSLLAFLSLVMGFIPFLFLSHGDRLLQHSKFLAASANPSGK